MMNILDKVKILKLENELKRLKKDGNIKRLLELEDRVNDLDKLVINKASHEKDLEITIGILINYIGKLIKISKYEFYNSTHGYKFYEDIMSNEFLIRGYDK